MRVKLHLSEILYHSIILCDMYMCVCDFFILLHHHNRYYEHTIHSSFLTTFFCLIKPSSGILYVVKNCECMSMMCPYYLLWKQNTVNIFHLSVQENNIQGV
jgi:hypothetical protein